MVYFKSGMTNFSGSPIPNLSPRGEITNHSHPRCYLRGTHNCSTNISREHYISKSILNNLGDDVRVSGMPWLSPGETWKASINSMAANILCKRHNESLSILDEEAGKFFDFLTKSLDNRNNNSLSRKKTTFSVNGDLLQLWMLKVACGIYFSVAAVDRVKVSENSSINLKKIEKCFYGGDWDLLSGLYFSGEIGGIISTKHCVDVAPLIWNENVFAGTEVILNGIKLHLFFDTDGFDFGEYQALLKPKKITIKNKKRTFVIDFNWSYNGSTRGIVLSKR